MRLELLLLSAVVLLFLGLRSPDDDKGVLVAALLGVLLEFPPPPPRSRLAEFPCDDVRRLVLLLLDSMLDDMSDGVVEDCGTRPSRITVLSLLSSPPPIADGS